MTSSNITFFLLTSPHLTSPLPLLSNFTCRNVTVPYSERINPVRNVRVLGISPLVVTHVLSYWNRLRPVAEISDNRVSFNHIMTDGDNTLPSQNLHADHTGPWSCNSWAGLGCFGGGLFFTQSTDGWSGPSRGGPFCFMSSNFDWAEPGPVLYVAPFADVAPFSAITLWPLNTIFFS